MWQKLTFVVLWVVLVKQGNLLWIYQCHLPKKEHLHWTISKIETRRTEKGKLWQYQTITSEDIQVYCVQISYWAIERVA